MYSVDKILKDIGCKYFYFRNGRYYKSYLTLRRCRCWQCIFKLFDLYEPVLKNKLNQYTQFGDSITMDPRPAIMENGIRYDYQAFLEHIEYMEKVIPEYKIRKYNFDVGKTSRQFV